MATVPSNLIPTRITQLPDAPVASEDTLLIGVYNGNTYKIRAGDLLQVAGVPTSRQVIAGTGLAGGGALSSNVTLSVAPGGIGTTQLAASGVTPGVYGDGTNMPQFTVDATGRVMAATTVPVSVSGFVPTSREVLAGNGLLGGGPLSSNVTLSVSYGASAPLPGANSGAVGTALTVSRSDHRHPAVDLASDAQIDGILGIGSGGTGRNLTMQPGAVVWSGADGMYVGPAGVPGQVLVSGGTAAPTWGSTLILAPVAANYMFAGPTTGSAADPTFRVMVNADLPASGVVANTYGSGAQVPVLVVNSKGVVTGASVVDVTPAWANITGTPTTIAGYGITDGVTLTGAQALTNKTIDASLNTLSNIPNAALSFSSVTINGLPVSLGGSITVTATASQALTIGTGLSGTSYNGSTAVTIANTGVLSLNGGTTGLTPAAAATGAITLGGTLVVANGGTGATTAAGARLNLSAAVLGANNDITSMTALTGGLSSPLFIQMGDGSAQTLAAGKLWYSATTGAWNLGMGGGNITQQVGEEIFVYGKASAAISDSPLQIVYKTGTVGGSGAITFGPTIAGITSGDLILGVATESLAHNSFGRITSFGSVSGITTDGAAFGETWADNDTIWYNPLTGNPTNVKPSAPNVKVSVGTVIKAGSGGSGSFQVEVNHGSVLGGTDSNVQLTGVAGGNLLQYDSGLGYWKNVASSAVSVGTASSLAGGAASQIPYQTGAGATGFIANGTAGQVLVSQGASVPVWSGISGGTF